MKKIRIGFIGRNQVDLLLVYREDWTNDIFATVVLLIKTPLWLQKLLWHRLGWYGVVNY